MHHSHLPHSHRGEVKCRTDQRLRGVGWDGMGLDWIGNAHEAPLKETSDITYAAC